MYFALFDFLIVEEKVRSLDFSEKFFDFYLLVMNLKFYKILWGRRKYVSVLDWVLGVLFVNIGLEIFDI